MHHKEIQLLYLVNFSLFIQIYLKSVPSQFFLSFITLKYMLNIQSVKVSAYVICHCSGGNQGWHVYYHFVGAVPGSTDMEKCLKRLLKELNQVNVSITLYQGYKQIPH